MLDKLVDYIVELDKDKVMENVKTMIANGEDPIKIVEEGQRGMTQVGNLFERGDYYLVELLLTAEIFKEMVAYLEPFMISIDEKNCVGKVIMATPQGDVHDIGKNIVTIMLRANGFEVYDLGVDVPRVTIIEKVNEINPDIVGISCLLTSVFDDMKSIVEDIHKSEVGGQCKIMIGGGVTSEQTRAYVGADFQTINVSEGVRFCLEVLNKGDANA